MAMLNNQMVTQINQILKYLKSPDFWKKTDFKTDLNHHFFLCVHEKHYETTIKNLHLRMRSACDLRMRSPNFQNAKSHWNSHFLKFPQLNQTSTPSFLVKFKINIFFVGIIPIIENHIHIVLITFL